MLMSFNILLQVLGGRREMLHVVASQAIVPSYLCLPTISLYRVYETLETFINTVKVLSDFRHKTCTCPAHDLMRTGRDTGHQESSSNIAKSMQIVFFVCSKVNAAR